MASLRVRKLDEETLAHLRMHAASHGVSIEEEARRILREAVSAPKRLGDLALQIFGPGRGVDLELPEYVPHRPIERSNQVACEIESRALLRRRFLRQIGIRGVACDLGFIRSPLSGDGACPGIHFVG
jgi:antitoxin FitA